MSGITTHIIDITTGKPGAGIPVVLERKTHSAGWQAIAEGMTEINGRSTICCLHATCLPDTGG